jgi:hypothetical protein
MAQKSDDRRQNTEDQLFVIGYWLLKRASACCGEARPPTPEKLWRDKQERRRACHSEVRKNEDG